MKKTYQIPTSNVEQIKLNSMILVGSPGNGLNIGGPIDGTDGD